MENPFKFGSIVTAERFADREDEINELLAAFSSGQNVIISSPRRYGKTSLLLETFSRLKRRNYLCVYVDLFRVSDKKRFVEIYTSTLARETLGAVEKWMKAFREWIPRVIPKVIFRGEEIPEVEFEVSQQSSEFDAMLEKVIDLPEKIAARRGKRIIVAFDEFQEVLSWNGDSLQKLMRARIQHHRNVAYCFLGSKRQLIGQLFMKEKSPPYQVGKMISLGIIPRQPFKEFILDHFEDEKISLPESLADQLLEITDSHPYYTQLLAYELWNRLAAGKKAVARTLEEAVQIVIASQSYAYILIWEAQSALRQALLRAVAGGQTSDLMAQETIRRFGLGSPSSVKKNLKILERDEILERRNGGYSFVDLFFREWLRLKPKIPD